MEFIASAFDQVKGFVKGVRRKGSSYSRRTSPIEILKRLQREAFSDVMKLRDRQDKLERTLSQILIKGNPFHGAGTQLRGMVDVAGALLFVDNDEQLACRTLDRVGIKRGTSLKFILETMVRQKDALVAEFLAGHNNAASDADATGNALVLDKVKYHASINDCLSLILMPLGARCSDFDLSSNISKRLPLSEPPFFSRHHKHAAGLVIKGSNAAASLAGLCSESWLLSSSAADTCFLDTFGQVTYQLFDEARLTISGLWREPRPIPRSIRMGPLVMPIGRMMKQAPSSGTCAADVVGPGSLSLMLESEFDESTRFGCWLEVQRANPGRRHWGFSLSDAPEDGLGWGLRLGRRVEGGGSGSNLSHLEGILNINTGDRSWLQPSLMFLMEGSSCNVACLLRLTWSM